MTVEAFLKELEIISRLDTLNGGGHFVIDDHVVERTDSVWRRMDHLVRRHVTDLQGRPLEPRYFLGLAHLELQLGDDAAAARYVEAWLKTPGVTTVDSAVAFDMAVSTVLGHDVTTARIAIARAYVTRLTALHTPQTFSYGVRLKMMEAFDRLGQSDSAATWGLSAYALIKDMSYEARAFSLTKGMPLMTLARNLAGLPNGLARLDSVLTVLKRESAPRSAEVAADTMLRVLQQDVSAQTQDAFTMVSWIGKPMPPFIATHWLNHDQPTTVSDAAPGARTLRLDDGVIRIIGFGWFSCPGCQLALRRAQLALSQLPTGVEVLFNERSIGDFRGSYVEPEEEAEALRKWYLDRKHYTFPIAIWAPVKDSTPWGGLMPRESPLWRALQIKVGPTLYLVDGRGIIRYMGFDFPRLDATTTHDPLRLALMALVREREMRERETHVDARVDVHHAQTPEQALLIQPGR